MANANDHAIERAIEQLNAINERVNEISQESKNGNTVNFSEYRQWRNSLNTLQENSNQEEQKFTDILKRSADLSVRGLHRATNASERNTSAEERAEVEKYVREVTQTISKLTSKNQSGKAYMAQAGNVNEYAYQIEQLKKLQDAIGNIQKKVYHSNENDNSGDNYKQQLVDLNDFIGNFITNLTTMQTTMVDNITVPQDKLLDLKVFESVLGGTANNAQNLRGALQNIFHDVGSVDGNNLKLLEQANTDAIALGESLQVLIGNIRKGDTLTSGGGAARSEQIQKVLGEQSDAVFQKLHSMAGTFNTLLSDVADTSLNNVANVYNQFAEVGDEYAKALSMVGLSIKRLKAENPNLDVSALEENYNKNKKKLEDQQRNAAQQMREGLASGLKKINDDINAGISTALGQMARGQGLASGYTSSFNSAGDVAAELWQDMSARERQGRWFSIRGFEFGPRGANFGTRKDDLSFISQAQFGMSGILDQTIGQFGKAEQFYKEGDTLQGDLAKQSGNRSFKQAVETQVKMSEHAKAALEKWRSLSDKEKERQGGKEHENRLMQMVESIKQGNLQLIQTQAAYDIDIDKDTKKQLDRLGKDSKAFVNIREELDKTEKESTLSLAKIKGFASSVASSIRSAAHSTKGLLDKFGLGSALMGPIETITKALQYHSEQGKARYGAMGLDASIGYTNLGDSAARAQSRLMAGNELYRMSGGMIKREEVNNLYSTLVKNVGGQYGGTADQTVQDMERFATSLTPLKTVYGVSDSTLQNAVQTYYKDMNLSASETEDAIAKLTVSAQNANVPLESYLSKVTSIAQAFMKIGIDGQKASVILNNFLNRGVRAEVAEEISQQVGSGLAKFAENDNLVGFSAATMGIDPFHAMAQMARTHDSRGNVRSAWVDEASALADNAMKYYMLPYGNDPNMQYWGRVKTYKQLFGFNQRTASTLASTAEKYGTESVEFKKMFKESMEEQENPNAKLENLNEKIFGQLQSMANQLAESDKLQAELDSNLYSVAGVMGKDIDKIVKEIAPILLTFQDEMIKWTVRALAFLTDIVKSQKFKDAVDLLVQGIHAIPELLGKAIDKISEGWGKLKDFFTGKDEKTGEDAADKMAGVVDSGAQMLEAPAAVAAGIATAKAIPGPAALKVAGGLAAGTATYFGLDKFREWLFSPGKDENGNATSSIASGAFRAPINYVGDNWGKLGLGAYFVGRQAASAAPGLWKIPAFLLSTVASSELLGSLINNGPVGTYDNAVGAATTASDAVNNSSWGSAATTIGTGLGTYYLSSKLFGGLLTGLSTSNPLRSGLGRSFGLGLGAMLISGVGSYAYDALFGDKSNKNEPGFFSNLISNIFGGSNKASAATLDQSNQQLNVPTSAEQIQQWDEQLKAAGYTEDERKRILAIRMNQSQRDDSHLGLYLAGFGAFVNRDSNTDHMHQLDGAINTQNTQTTKPKSGTSKSLKLFDAVAERFNVLRLSPEDLNKYHAQYGTMSERFKKLLTGSWTDLKTAIVNMFKNVKDNARVWLMNLRLKWKNWRTNRLGNDVKSMQDRIKQLTQRMTKLNAEIKTSSNPFTRSVKQILLDDATSDLAKVTKQYTSKFEELKESRVNRNTLRNARDSLNDTIKARKGFTDLVNNTMSRVYNVIAPETSLENQIKSARRDLAKTISQTLDERRNLRTALRPYNEQLSKIPKVNGVVDLGSSELKNVINEVTLRDGSKISVNEAKKMLNEIENNLKNLTSKNTMKILEGLEKTGVSISSKVALAAFKTNDLIKVGGVSTRNAIRRTASGVISRVKGSISSAASKVLAKTGSVGATIVKIIHGSHSLLTSKLATLASIAVKIGEHFKIGGLGGAAKVADTAAKGSKGFLKSILRAIPGIGIALEGGSYIMDVIDDMQNGVSFSTAAWEQAKAHSTDIGLAVLSTVLPGAGGMVAGTVSMIQGASYLATGKGIDEHIGDLMDFHLSTEDSRKQTYIQDLMAQGLSPDMAKAVIESNGGFQADTAKILQYAHGITTQEELEALMSGDNNRTPQYQDTNDDTIEPLERDPQSEEERYRNSEEYRRAQELERQRRDSQDEVTHMSGSTDTNVDTGSRTSSTDTKTDDDHGILSNLGFFSTAHAAEKGFLRGGTYSQDLIARATESKTYNEDAKKLLKEQLPQFDEQRKANIEEYKKRVKTIDEDKNISDEDKKSKKEQVYKEFEDKDRNIQIKQDNLLATTAGENFDASSFDMDKFNEEAPDEKKSRFGSEEDKKAWEQTTGNITSGMTVNANDRPETRAEAADSRAKVTDKVTKAINDEQKEEHKLSKERNKSIEDFIKLHTKLMGDFQDAVTDQHKNLWKMMAVTHQILVDLNKTVARGAAFATDAILRSGGGGGTGGTGTNNQQLGLDVPNDAETGAMIEAAAKKYNIDPNLLKGLAAAESGWNQNVTSPVGAIGVMQLMPETAAGLGVNPNDKAQNIEGGAKFLRQMLDMFNGNEQLAVAAYNAGPGAVQKYNGIPPYGETQAYVPRVLGFRDRYASGNYGDLPNTSSTDTTTTNTSDGSDTQTITASTWNDNQKATYQALKALNYSDDSIASLMSVIGINNENFDSTFDDEHGGLFKLTAGSDLYNRAKDIMGNDTSVKSQIKAALQAMGEQHAGNSDYFFKNTRFQNAIGEFGGDHGLRLSSQQIAQARSHSTAWLKDVRGANTAGVTSSYGATTAAANYQVPQGRNAGGSTLPLYAQSGPTNCTSTAAEMALSAWTGQIWAQDTLNLSTWGDTVMKYADEIPFSSQQSFNSYVTQWFSQNPNIPLMFMQTGGLGSSASNPHPLNAHSGSHMVVIARQLANGQFEVYDPNGGKKHTLELNQLYDTTAGGGHGRFGNQWLPTGHALYVPKNAVPVSNYDTSGASTGGSSSIQSPGIAALYNAIFSGHATVAEYYDETKHRAIAEQVRISNQGNLTQGVVDDKKDDKKDDDKKEEEDNKRYTYLTGLENKPQEVDASFWTKDFWSQDASQYTYDDTAKNKDLSNRRFWENQYDKEHPSLVSDNDSRNVQRNLTSQQLLQYYGIDLSQLSADERKQASQDIAKNISLGKGLNGEQISDDQLKQLMDDQHLTREQALAQLYKDQYRYKNANGEFDDRITYTGKLDEDMLNLGIELQKLLSADHKDADGKIVSGKITKESLEDKKNEYAEEFKKQMKEQNKEYTDEDATKYVNQRIEDAARYIQVQSATGTFYTNQRGKELWDKQQQAQRNDFKTLASYSKNGMPMSPHAIEQMRSDMLHSRYVLDSMNNPDLDETEWLKSHNEDVTQEDAQRELAKSLRYRLNDKDLLSAFGYSVDKGNFELPGDPDGSKRKMLTERLLASNLASGKDINGNEIDKSSKEWKEAISTAEKRMMEELNNGQKVAAEQQEELLKQVRTTIKDNQAYFNDTVMKIYHELKDVKLDIAKVAPIDMDKLPDLALMAGHFSEMGYQWKDYRSELYTDFRGDLDSYNGLSEDKMNDPKERMAFINAKRQEQMQKQMSAYDLFVTDDGDKRHVGRMNYYHEDHFSMNNRGDTNLGAGSGDIMSTVLDATKDSEGKNGLEAVSMDWTISQHQKSRELMRDVIKDRYLGLHDLPVDPKTGLQFGAKRLNPNITGNREGLNIHREATSNILRISDKHGGPETTIRFRSNLPESVINRIKNVLQEFMKDGKLDIRIVEKVAENLSDGNVQAVRQSAKAAQKEQ